MPKAVAMAVSTVIVILKILLQMFLFSVSIFIVDVFGGTDYTDYTEPVLWLYSLRLVWMTRIHPVCEKIRVIPIIGTIRIHQDMKSVKSVKSVPKIIRIIRA